MLFCLQSAIATHSYQPWSQCFQGCLDVSRHITNTCKYRITALQRNKGFMACGEHCANETQERQSVIMWRTKLAYYFSLDHFIKPTFRCAAFVCLWFCFGECVWTCKCKNVFVSVFLRLASIQHSGSVNLLCINRRGRPQSHTHEHMHNG